MAQEQNQIISSIYSRIDELSLEIDKIQALVQTSYVELKQDDISHLQSQVAMCESLLEHLPLVDESGNIKFIKDKDGLLLPTYDDCYNKEQTNIIHNLYGDNNLSRFELNSKIYDELGIDSIHKIYIGNHKTVFNNRNEIVDDIVNYIISQKKNISFIH